MFARYLQRGVAAGVVAGIAYAAYMVFVGNPLSEYVHEAESGAGHDHGHAHAHEAGEHAHEAGTVVSETTV
ncbi:MAG: CbtA family protein, partial [Natronomonas sp.]|uniref:CbtA family protein n=1 Tax=Natronomonas sp. TaxID=2184060 RepID=UPI0028702147